MISAAIVCLAMNVYFEARGENLSGQQAVALVTLNRAGGDRKKICKEVHKPSQFSWTLEEQAPPTDQAAWKIAKQVATDVVAGRVVDFTGGATYFHTKDVNPEWKRRMKFVMTLGRHRFYRAV